jgi:subfamily B ATP-binding cassette protein MsbA
VKEKKKNPLLLTSTWREARRLMWAHRKMLGLGLLLMVFNRLSGFVLPGSSKYLIDEVIGNGRTELLTTLAFAVGGATLVQAVSSFALSQVISVAAQRAIMDMRRRMHEHVIRLPIRFFDDTKSGVLISRIMSDAEGIRNLIGTGIILLVGGVFTAVLALGVLFYLNWQVTTITLLILTVFGVVMSQAFRKLRPIFRERQKINAEVTGRLGETLGGIRIVKAYGTEDREQSVFSQGVDRLFQNIASSITGVSATTAFGTFVIGLIGVVMIIMGGNAITAGSMTLGDFVMYVFFIGVVAAPIIQMANIGTQISEAFAGLDRIRELLQMNTEDEEDEYRESLADVVGNIKFENVDFAYQENVPVLKKVSLVAEAGTTTALVGSSGSGKSTLASLVMAFNRPDQGQIFIDDKDLARVRLKDYRSNLGVVLQENFLFDGTVEENIRFARPDATREDVVAVSRIANAHTFIEGFPEGYDSIVGERGIKLSGGQRQRIAIARAILADPRILILDEATSSLDSESEALIQEGFRNLRQGRTTFVIAHRLSTIRSADQILVLEDGEIIERGTHERLMAKGGRYRDLHDQQYKWEQDLFINPGEDFTPVEGVKTETG